jgi:hypothetical protein
MAIGKKRTKTYACKRVLLSCGSHSVSGYAEDSFIVVEANSEGTTKVVGCDGEVARSLDPDETYKLKVTLLQTSDSNAFFQRRYDLDQQTGMGTFPVLCTDLMGQVIFQSDEMWVTNKANRTYGKTAQNIEWQLDGGAGKWTD